MFFLIFFQFHPVVWNVVEAFSNTAISYSVILEEILHRKHTHAHIFVMSSLTHIVEFAIPNIVAIVLVFSSYNPGIQESTFKKLSYLSPKGALCLYGLGLSGFGYAHISSGPQQTHIHSYTHPHARTHTRSFRILCAPLINVTATSHVHY